MPQPQHQLPLEPSEPVPLPVKNDWQTASEIPLSDRSQPGSVLIKTVQDQRVRLRCTVPKCRYRATIVNLPAAQQRASEHAGRHQFGPSYQLPDLPTPT